MPLSLSADDDDDDEITILPSPSKSSSPIDTESEHDDEPDESMTHARNLKLPAWARGHRNTILAKQSRTEGGQNRKRRRLSIDSNDEKSRKKSEPESEANDSDDSLLFDEPRSKKKEVVKERSLTPPTAVPTADLEAALAAARCVLPGRLKRTSQIVIVAEQYHLPQGAL